MLSSPRWATLLRETDPRLVTLELDAGWARTAGVDPTNLLNRYAGRFRLVHVKDIRASTHTHYSYSLDPTEVGRGIISWRQVLNAGYDAGIRNYFIEQEPSFKKDPF